MRHYLIILCHVLLIIPAGAAGMAPAVTGITPSDGLNTTTVSITNLAGTNFTSGAIVMLTPSTVSPVHKGSIVNGTEGATIDHPLSVHVSGNYAYVTSSMSNSLEIVDISNPAVPVHKGKIVLGPATYQPDDVFVSGNYAYITISGGPNANALEIVDVSNPATPFQIGNIKYLDGSGALLNNPQSVYVSGNYAYVASAGSNALEIVNVSNPAAPVHKGSIVHGTEGALLINPQSVVISGNYAYIASAGSDALEIVDVSNPAEPVHKSSIVHGAEGALLINPKGVYIAGDYAYVVSYDSDALEIIDISNPAAPSHKGSISHLEGGALLYSPESVHVSGNYAYVASSRSNALEIVDVSNPAVPVHKGSIVNGDGGAILSNLKDVYVSGSYAYLVGYSNALEIIDIHTVTATAVMVGSPNQITCTFDLTNKPAGLYNVVVTNPDGNFGTLNLGFTVIDPDAPIADFTAAPLSGRAPLNVTFQDRSANSPTSWNWSFGDGGYSTAQNPAHTYTLGGAYTVALNVTNTEGTNTLTRADYIIVNGDQIGVFRNVSGTWYLDYNNTGTVDKTYQFGKNGDITVIGDWNGDGTADSGVFRPSVGYWYLNYYKDSISDKKFQFGKNGDIPVVGDWNGDGTSDIGVFRPSVGYWYLDITKTGVVYHAFQFGKYGDMPVTGDWNGDGKTDTGVFRLSVGNWYLDTTNTGVVYKSFQFGKTGDVPVVADWTGDGTSDAGIFRPAGGNWYLNYYKNSTTNKVLHFGKIGDVPKAGTWFTVIPNASVPIAAFTSSIQTGIAPLTVQFTDQSTSNVRLTYAWDFNNDGIMDSTAKDPAYTYTTSGNYSVNLTVTNAAGSDSLVRVNYISVPFAPVAEFTSDVQNGTAPLTVQFTDQSTGTTPLTYAWDFTNDGVTDSTARNPSHIYPAAGNYTVNFTVTNGAGSDVRTEPDYIIVTEAPSGIALTFDDNYVNSWYAARDILLPYSAHATFFVSQYEDLEEYQIIYLKELQKDGHEIAFHGLDHTDAAEYLETHTIPQYLDYEIIPGINDMQADGFNPVDFSYPYGSGADNIELRVALQQYFIHLRDINHGSVYYEYGSNTPVINAQGIDDTTYGQSLDDLYNYISTAKENDEIVIFYGHKLVSSNPGEYETSYDRLDKILKYVSDNNLKTFTISEIH